MKESRGTAVLLLSTMLVVFSKVLSIVTAVVVVEFQYTVMKQ